MFSKAKTAISNNKDKVTLLVASSTALATSAVTFSGGVVTFEAGDTAVMDETIGNGIQNFWGGLSFVGPYIGAFIGIALVAGIGFFAVKKLRG